MDIFCNAVKKNKNASITDISICVFKVNQIQQIISRFSLY